MDVNTSPGRDTAEAVLVFIKQGDEERRITVELSGTAAAAGQQLSVYDAVSGYLEDEEPPTHLIVTTNGVYPAQ